MGVKVIGHHNISRGLDLFLQGIDYSIRFSLYALALAIPFGNAPVEIFANLCAWLFLFEQLLKGCISLRLSFRLGTLETDGLMRPAFMAVTFYVFWNILSACFSIDIPQSAGAIFTKLLEGVFVFFACVFHMRKREHVRIFLIFFLLGAFVASIDGIFQWFSGRDFIRGSSLHLKGAGDRVSAVFKHSNGFGGYLICVLPLLFSFLFQKRASIERKVVRYVLSVVFILCFCVFGLTFSRGAWFGFLVSFLFLGLNNKKILLAVLAVCVLFATIFFPLLISHRAIIPHNQKPGAQYFFSTKFLKYTSSGRYRFWQDAFYLARRHPFFGSGLNTYTEAIKDDSQVRQGFYAHNCYLQMAEEIGFVGLAGFLVIIFVLFRTFFQHVLFLKDSFLTVAIWGFAASLTAFLVHAFFDTTMYSVQLGIMHWLLMGMILAVFSIDKPVDS